MARFVFVVSVAVCLLCCTLLTSAEVSPDCKTKVKAKCTDNFKKMCAVSPNKDDCETAMNEFTVENKSFKDISIIAGMFPDKYPGCRALFNRVQFTFDGSLTRALNAMESKMGDPCAHMDTIEDVANSELIGKIMDISNCHGDLDCLKVSIIEFGKTIYENYDKNSDKLQTMFSKVKDGSTDAGCNLKQHFQDVLAKHQATMSAMGTYTMTNIISNCKTATSVLPAVAGEAKHYACGEPIDINNMITPMKRHMAYYKPKCNTILQDILGELFSDVVACGTQIFAC